MMHHYITLPDEAVVTHSHLISIGNETYIKVHFERSVDGGFLSARCLMPGYEWEYIEGFSVEIIKGFVRFLEQNELALFQRAMCEERNDICNLS